MPVEEEAFVRSVQSHLTQLRKILHKDDLGPEDGLHKADLDRIIPPNQLEGFASFPKGSLLDKNGFFRHSGGTHMLQKAAQRRNAFQTYSRTPPNTRSRGGVSYLPKTGGMVHPHSVPGLGATERIEAHLHDSVAPVFSLPTEGAIGEAGQTAKQDVNDPITVPENHLSASAREWVANLVSNLVANDLGIPPPAHTSSTKGPQRRRPDRRATDLVNDRAAGGDVGRCDPPIQPHPGLTGVAEVLVEELVDCLLRDAAAIGPSHAHQERPLPAACRLHRASGALRRAPVPRRRSTERAPDAPAFAAAPDANADSRWAAQPLPPPPGGPSPAFLCAVQSHLQDLRALLYRRRAVDLADLPASSDLLGSGSIGCPPERLDVILPAWTRTIPRRGVSSIPWAAGRGPGGA